MVRALPVLLVQPAGPLHAAEDDSKLPGQGAAWWRRAWLRVARVGRVCGACRRCTQWVPAAAAHVLRHALAAPAASTPPPPPKKTHKHTHTRNTHTHTKHTRTKHARARQVTLNQLALAPVTLAAVFGWNLALTGRAAALPAKLQHDLVPSMVNGASAAWAAPLLCARACACCRVCALRASMERGEHPACPCMARAALPHQRMCACGWRPSSARAARAHRLEVLGAGRQPQLLRSARAAPGAAPEGAHAGAHAAATAGAFARGHGADAGAHSLPRCRWCCCCCCCCCCCRCNRCCT
jgi:hypothetical protein